jgi:hypothetical protein
MKKSSQWQIIAIAVLIVIAVVDALSLFVPIAAVGGIALLLFRPKWLYNFFQTLYDKTAP